MTTLTPELTDARRGVLAGIAAYSMWGLFPLYFHHLRPSGALEIVCHRIVWSLIVTAVIIVVARDRRWIGELLANRRLLAQLTLAAVLLSCNWLVYVWTVDNDRVVEAALGYFINPLVTVSLGVVVLREHLRRLQWVAVGFGVAAVAVLTAAYGQVPWVALTLAFSFAGYGYLKKRIPLPPAQSLAAETTVLAPAAIVVMVVLEARGSATFGHAGVGHAIRLVLSGPITAAPLLCFAAAARRIPLTLLGLLQYLTPVGQFLCGVLVFHETLSPATWMGFTLVWGALVVLSVDAVTAGRGTTGGHRGRAPQRLNRPGSVVEGRHVGPAPTENPVQT